VECFFEVMYLYIGRFVKYLYHYYYVYVVFCLVLFSHLCLFVCFKLFVCLREEFFLKTDSGYPKDTGVTLFTLVTPRNLSPLRYKSISHLHYSPSPSPGNQGEVPVTSWHART